MTKYYGIVFPNGDFMYTYRWDSCKKAIDNHKGSKYKSFTNKEDMYDWENNIHSTYYTKYNLNKGLVVYSDGGSNTIDGKPRKKGSYYSPTDVSSWAYVITKDGKELYKDSGFNQGKTNNYQELQGAYRGLEKLIKEGYVNDNILFVTDSQYVINSINYTGKFIKSKPNMIQVDALRNIFKRFKNIKIRWVKGHQKTVYNNMCDEMCSEELKKHMKK